MPQKAGMTPPASGARADTPPADTPPDVHTEPGAAPDVVCIGSALWDLIGRTPANITPGGDVPGRIVRQPGGVAMNVAMTLRRFGLVPALLTAVGRDAEGDALLAVAAALGIVTAHVHRSDLPTDRYMAIEGAGGLIAAIADAHSLERAGDAILGPLTDGPLAGWRGPVVLDGNLTEATLAGIAVSPAFADADLRVAPASPGKAMRLLQLIAHPGATFYVNRIEAGLLLHADPRDAAAAAAALRARGAHRVLVTDGAGAAALADADGIVQAVPPPVLVTRVTGAGDTVMAAHVAAELRGERAADALATALAAAAQHVAGDVPG
jgi:sugar/nucleoside kinase (ribokinase family)